MPDVIDHACGVETQFQQMALARQLAGGKRTQQRESAQECGECGDPIPEKRRQKVPGCQLCTPCQSAKECR
ncbi:TraR/DksA C4-type zinc finger protein [Vibrio furnissii]|uniref:TraR/DksA C4-type zinc finger protein n=1 Tax=Vibrio furnissii TaxID=29494 RepID=UPI001EEB9974|nr:TraR/DksA C4-type zinc finger protein [Vibrio furnissii]